jgi:hypothetical protein
MARLYSLNAGGLTLANQAVTLAFLNPAAGPSPQIRIKRVTVGQSGSTTSAMQRIQLVTQVTAFPTLTSSTPKTITLGDPASAITGGTAGAAGTSGVNASAEGGGTKTVRKESTFNVLNGYEWIATPEDFINLQAGSTAGFGVFLPVAASSLSNWQVEVVFSED